MAETFIPDRITPLDYRPLVDAIREVCPNLTAKAVLILAAHIAFETAMESCHCYDVGNRKRVKGQPWTMFKCGENVPLPQAQKLRAESPELIVFKGKAYPREGQIFQEIIVKPPHPWSHFAAFSTLADGVRDHIAMLQGARYNRAWILMSEGNLVGYVNELKRKGYFSADLGAYLPGVQRWHRIVRGKLLGRPTLKLETRATQDQEQVRFWQEKALGLTGDDVDGDFGPATKKLTSDWQKAHGLSGDGEVGAQSWALLLPDAEVL